MMTQKQALILMLLVLPCMSVATAQESEHVEVYPVQEPAKVEVQDLPPAEFSAGQTKQEAEAQAAEQAKQEAEAKAKAKAEAEAKVEGISKDQPNEKALAATQADSAIKAQSVEPVIAQAEATSKTQVVEPVAAPAGTVESATTTAQTVEPVAAQAGTVESATTKVQLVEPISAPTEAVESATAKTQAAEPVAAPARTVESATPTIQVVTPIAAPVKAVGSAISQTQAAESVTAQAGTVESATTTTQVVEPIAVPAESATVKTQAAESVTAQAGTVESATITTQIVEPVAAPAGAVESATSKTQVVEPVASPAGAVESATPKVQLVEPIAVPAGTAESATSTTQVVEPTVVQPAEQTKQEGETNAAEKLRLEAIAKSKKLLAEKNNVLLDTVQKAVLKNPDVLSRWENFKAAVKETDAARGAYFPQLDISSGQGREKYLATPAAATLMDRHGYTVTLKQMLYDGFATRNEVRRLTNAQLARYYELLDASESAALEALRAYYDVARNRKLFELTEDNYVLTRTVLEQITQKVKAGVGRRVDLEQSAGRLALSQSNLVMDNANIHDVSARYQRVVGELPPERLENSATRAMYKSMVKEVLPNAAGPILAVGVEFHPAILAAVENVRSAKYDMYERWGKFQPTVNLNISQTNNINYTGIAGLTSDTIAEVTLSWNLFNGGTDRARSGQYASKLEAVRDQRDKTCRDIRMTLAIAYNDISKITDQLEFLDQHQLAIEKARGAYQKQFEIGQRTLLDVLDSENELYQARRAYTNAEFDLKIAYVRTLAGMGRLVNTLGIPTLEANDLPELLGTSSEGPENCPPEPPLSANIPYDELNARAIEAAKPPELPPNLDAPMATSGVPGVPAAPAPGSQADLDAKAAAEAEQFMLNPNEIKAKQKAKAGK